MHSTFKQNKEKSTKAIKIFKYLKIILINLYVEHAMKNFSKFTGLFYRPKNIELQVKLLAQIIPLSETFFQSAIKCPS